MVLARGDWVVRGLLLGTCLSVTVSTARAQDSSLPPLQGPVVTTEPPATPAPRHDVLPAAQPRPQSERAPKTPPEPIQEEPSDDRTDPKAQWVPGYWSWSPAKEDFVWVVGRWQVPPAGASWVASRWMRDADGWYRVPGFWNTPRRDRAVVTAGNWRADGPPADHPDDTPGAAPGPNYFYVPGHYTPDGDRLAWTNGFWAKEQPGWDWVPARWVRRPGGWTYRDGYWLRDSELATQRHTVARPSAEAERDGDLPPAIVESEPSDKDPLPNPPANARRDPISEAESGLPPYRRPRFGYVPPPVVIRPPGMYPYGPAGVVVPGAVPPFVQRLLDRVLP